MIKICKHLVLIILFFGFALKGNSQIGMGFWGGYTTHKFNSACWGDFMNNYNNDFSQYLEKPFNLNIKPMTGWGWNYSFFINNGFDFRGNTGISHLESNNEAIFKNGNVRNIDFKSTDWTLDIGIGVGAKGFFLDFNVGMNWRFASTILSYQFNDGSISYGKDHDLNGIYDGSRLTGLVGSTAGISFSPFIQLVYRIDKVFPLQGDNQTYWPYMVDKIFRGDYSYKYFVDFTGLRHTFALQISILEEL